MEWLVQQLRELSTVSSPLTSQHSGACFFGLGMHMEWLVQQLLGLSTGWQQLLKW